jgi:hypothetical protein
MKSGEAKQALTMRGGGSGDHPMHFQPCYFDADQLYDLEADPTEQTNLADDTQYADVLKDLQGRLKKYLERLDDPFDLDTVDPFVKSDAYRELAKKSLADKSIYEYYFYKEKAY